MLQLFLFLSILSSDGAISKYYAEHGVMSFYTWGCKYLHYVFLRDSRRSYRIRTDFQRRKTERQKEKLYSPHASGHLLKYCSFFGDNLFF